MATIADGNVVEMNYTLSNTAGDVLDSSKDKAPLAYLHGYRNIVPGLEKELTGKKVGDALKVTVSPEEAYGMRDDAMIQTVPRQQFGEHAAGIQVGMQFHVQDQYGRNLAVTAVEVGDQEVVLDGNHPLAGETLHFEVEVVSLRDATEEELSTGRVNEKDCCSNPECC